ncbi:zinc ribbon domain-containing protein [Nodularia spumigena]|uniref:zinc ribbon domain-containing protein n=1 Tax=Nodularia spumigena TaxID=70799 RepID=UPI003B967E34
MIDGIPVLKLVLIAELKKENLTLNERVFQCENCGFECDRDLNAAINLSKIDLSKAVS